MFKYFQEGKKVNRHVRQNISQILNVKAPSQSFPKISIQVFYLVRYLVKREPMMML